MVDAVVSKPAEELPVNNAKYILNCTELFLAHKGIQVLGGFDQFVNLEVLWLNNNKVGMALVLGWRGWRGATGAAGACGALGADMRLRAAQLAEIVNLDACIRIKELYAHNNNIECVVVTRPW